MFPALAEAGPGCRLRRLLPSPCLLGTISSGAIRSLRRRLVVPNLPVGVFRSTRWGQNGTRSAMRRSICGCHAYGASVESPTRQAMGWLTVNNAS